MSNYISELEQHPYCVDEFIERLAWRATDGKFEEESFDPDSLYEAFENEIKDLKNLYNTNQKRCEHLEMICREEEKSHWIKVASLQQKCKDALTTFEKLDKRLDVIADKVVYLGEQLEGVNTPRTRAVEAQKLMKHFAHYLKAQPNANPFENEIFLNDINKLYEEADIIQKLHLISQELPSGSKFDRAKSLIDQRYNTIEEQLIEEFLSAQKNDDKAKMKKIASVLSHFKSYNHGIDVFIEQSQMGIFLGENLFNDIVNLCIRNQKIIKEVFPNPDQVLAKFVLNIFHGKIQEYIQAKLEENSKQDYLLELYTLFTKTSKLVAQLSKHNFLGLDNNFLDKIARNIFAKYLDQYVAMETNYLREKCAHILQSYYDSKNHQKRPISTNTIQELIQSKITRTNLNIGLANLNLSSLDSNETLLSEEIAISILQETKMSLQRCQVMSKGQDVARNVLQLYEIELQYLGYEHIIYAIELAIQLVTNVDAKSQPDNNFYNTVRQCSAISHLMEKQFTDSVLPLISSTSMYAECLNKKRNLVRIIETKLNQGIEKSTMAIVSWVKSILQSEQKKTDFRPESDAFVPTSTSACMKVVKFIDNEHQKIVRSLDSQNLENILYDLGVKTHRIIYDHIQQYQYNVLGAMVLICDVKEYRNAIDKFKNETLSDIFNILHALCNLLIIAPSNLKQIIEGDQLKSLDPSIISSFVQLRSDYKTAKIYSYLK